MKTIPKNQFIPAAPPLDYKGTMADWYIELEKRGLEIDNYISQDEWHKILDNCERG